MPPEPHRPPSAGVPSIALRGVTRRFDTFLAVDDVSFDVYPGEIVGLLGPNGAGKSTTLRMLATLMRPDAGTIHVGGHDALQDPLAVRRLLGYQTGDTGLYQRLTPREFLRYFGSLHGMPRDLLEDRVDHAIRDFDLRAFADRVCRGLSTGQRQRVSLARTILHDPAALVLDEPTSGLDVVAAGFITAQLRRLADAGKAVLFSTHILSEVELLCDRVLVIDHGRVVAAGTVEALVERTGAANFAAAFIALISDARGAAPAREDAA